LAESSAWIMLSATPRDNWLDFATIVIANGYFKTLTHFKREHVVYNSYAKFPKVDRNIGVGKLLNMRSKIIVEMQYKRHTKRHILEDCVGYNKPLYDEVVKNLWNVFDEAPVKDVADVISVLRRIVNTDPARAEAIG